MHFQFIDENTLLISFPDSDFEVTLKRVDSASEAVEANAVIDTPDETIPEEDRVYDTGYKPSESQGFDTNKLIGKYTSDNGNVYSENFYTSGEPGPVGVVYLNKDPIGSAEESMEILDETTNLD